MKQEIDFSKIMELLQGSKDLLGRVLEVAVTDWDMQLGLLEKAIQNKDYVEIRKRVHRIKGAVQNFYYQRLVAKLAEYELAAEAEEKRDWEAFLRSLRDELKTLEAEVLKFKNGPA